MFAFAAATWFSAVFLTCSCVSSHFTLPVFDVFDSRVISPKSTFEIDSLSQIMQQLHVAVHNNNDLAFAWSNARGMENIFYRVRKKGREGLIDWFDLLIDYSAALYSHAGLTHDE